MRLYFDFSDGSLREPKSFKQARDVIRKYTGMLELGEKPTEEQKLMHEKARDIVHLHKIKGELNKKKVEKIYDQYAKIKDFFLSKLPITERIETLEFEMKRKDKEIAGLKSDSRQKDQKIEELKRRVS